MYYLPGEDNDAANQLSRWRIKGLGCLGDFSINNEVQVDLRAVLGKVLGAQEHEEQE